MAFPTEWTYRKSHTITHPSGGLSNYQTKIRVYRTTGIDSGDTVYVGDKCRADFGDIRFTNSAGTELDYWMEINAGTYADFWVELDTVGTTTTIYIYYGNSSATTTSNGDTTFPFFDDFSGTSLNTSKWNPTLIAFNGGVGTIAVNNTLTITNTNSATGVGLSSLNALGTDSAYRIRTKVNARSTGSTSTAQSRIVLTSTTADPNVFGLYNNSSEGGAYLHQGFGIGNPYISETFVTSTPRIYDYECKVANPKLYKDNTLVITGTGTPTAPPGTYIRVWVYSTTTAITLDYILARAYATTEPTHSTWGVEEILAQPLANWAYRQSHVINGSVTDYQVKLTLQYGVGESSSDTVYLQAHARPDFGDVRFTDSAGNLLSYWIESQTNGSTAIVWVKGTFSGDTTIYVYYGNATAGTTSNGDTTFDFFDDFTGDLSKWTNYGGTTLSGGIATISATSTAIYGITSTQTFGTGYAVAANVRYAHYNTSSYLEAFFSNYVNDTNQVSAYTCHIGGSAYYPKYNNVNAGNLGAVAMVGVSAGNYLRHECKKMASSAVWTVNYESEVTNSSQYVSTAGAVRFVAYGSGSSISIDWIYVRKYNAIDIIHSSWGAEQDLSATSFTIRITPTTGTDPLSVTYNCIIPEGTLDNFTLSYGDGNEYTTASQSSFATTHVYNEPGTYTVWGEGYTEFAAHVYYEIPYGVNVSAPSVVASFTISQSYNTITFTNTSTGNINECYWTFGDGRSSYEQNPVHTYWSPATYNVTLYTSNQYQYSSVTSNVTITQILTPPSAYFTPARLDVVNPTLPYNVTFTNLSTPTFGCTYDWTVDGGSVSTSENPSISFATHGVYDIGLTVTNALGSSSRVYNDAIRLTRKSRTMNEVVGSADIFATFGCHVFVEYPSGSDLPLVYATILPEGVYFIQREIPDVPGIDEWGVRHLYSTINEWGIRIFTALNSWGHKILHNSSSVDRTPLRCIDVEIFEETINISDDHQFDENPS